MKNALIDSIKNDSSGQEVLKQHYLRGVIDTISLQCQWLIVEEGIYRQCLNHTHEKLLTGLRFE
ncbi:MAG: hypothetical protein IJ628_05205 [Bacteroidaceae bacterium]|nr:hypothetical protein [Bacteroidaceae bacterium]